MQIELELWAFDSRVAILCVYERAVCERLTMLVSVSGVRRDEACARNCTQFAKSKYERLDICDFCSIFAFRCDT